MSAQPRPRSNFVQFMLIAAVVFLGMQLLFPTRQSDTRNSEQILAEMRQMNAEGKDVTIARLAPIFDQKSREEQAGKGWTDEQVEARHVMGQVLVAHTKFKTGLDYDGRAGLTQYAHHKISAGQQILQNLYAKHHSTEVWNQKVAVAPDEKLPEPTVTPGSLYDAMVADLIVRNKKQSVWGLDGYQIVDSLVAMTGRVPGLSYWVAAFILALVVRLIVFPLAQKQFIWGRQMQQLQPFVKELQKKYGVKPGTMAPPEVQQKLQAETMALYKQYGVNPFSGCLPALIQLPLFLFVYQCMLLYKFEFTKGTFLWIAPGTKGSGFIQLAPNLGQVDHLLVLFYGVSMVVSQYLMPVSDPSNVRQQRIMGLAIALIVSVMMFFYPVPSAFILYWLFANVLATAHALWAYSRPAPALVQVQSAEGGVIPGATTVDPTFFKKTKASPSDEPKPKKPPKRKQAPPDPAPEPTE
jgi:YidC/Oxa1 family membrane protein insertase